MTPQHKKKEPTCTIKCPAIRGDDKGTWYCRIMKAYVAPSEYHFEYGFDVVREGNITHSGYSTPCNAMELFHSRPAPSPDPRVAFFEEDNAYKDSIIEQQRIHINTLNVKMSEMMQGAAAQAREKVLEQLSDLNRYACQEYDEASCSDNEREMRIHLEYGNRTWGIIRSLRTGGEP